MSSKTYRRIEGLFWIGIGLLICYLAWRAHLGTFMEPGPGFMAFVVGLFISIVSLIMFLTQIFSAASKQDVFDIGLAFQKVPKARLGLIAAALVCYALFVGKLGYIIATFLLMWFLLYDGKKKNWLASLLSSIAIVMGSYFLFEVWLRSQLPRGLLPWW